MSSSMPGQGSRQPPSPWGSNGPYGAPVGYQQHVVVPRNPALYAIASLLLAGLGTALCGRVGTGIFIFCTVVFTAMLMAIPLIGLLFVPLWFCALFLSAYHGFRSAKQWNARHGIIS